MKFDTHTVEEFLDQCADKKNLVIQIITLIQKYYPRTPWIYDSKLISMIGYGTTEYKGESHPVIGITPQKNYVTVRIVPYDLINEFAWKKIKTGSNCLKIFSFTPADKDHFIELLSAINRLDK
ncbi:MAG: hypothetical protein ACRCV0_03980 [Brevinema sp.]